MRAHTITTMSRRRRQRRRRALAVALGVCVLVIPSIASARPLEPTSDYSTPNAVLGGSDDSSQPTGGSGHSSLNSIVPPASEQGAPGGSSVGSGYSSLNAISGPSVETPTFVASSPSSSSDGFDWASALVGAGAALALAALGTAAMLTVRRRTAVTPSPSAS